MTSILNLLLITVVVGLSDGQKLAVENPQFTGFIQTQDSATVLFYKQERFHGEFPVNSIQRIDFGYSKGKPFPLTVTLKNGQKLEVQSERRDFVMLKGQTEAGPVIIRHPDPISTSVQLRARKPNRKKDLTIEYLEFPSN